MYRFYLKNKTFLHTICTFSLKKCKNSNQNILQRVWEDDSDLSQPKSYPEVCLFLYFNTHTSTLQHTKNKKFLIRGAQCIQKSSESRVTNHKVNRSLLRSSSDRVPRHPLSKVVCYNFFYIRG